MDLSPGDYRELSQRIHRLCGLVLGPDKTYLVRHRLEPLVRDCGLEGFAHLLRVLRTQSGAKLHDAVIEAITTKETRFFRDPALFKAIWDHVLPERTGLLRSSGGRRQRIRVWSAAASTGQEAYSMAMLVRDFVDATAQPDHAEHHFAILASDISAIALETAKAGLYSRADVAKGLSEGQLRRHFHRRGDRWVVAEPLQRLVQFRRFNLLQSPVSLGAFDLILCRNVLIYFDEPTRKQICRGLYDALYDGGWLALGSAESLYGVEDRMEAIKAGRAVLYRKPQRPG